MIRYNQIKISAAIPVKNHRNKLLKIIADKLNIKVADISNLNIVRRSIDARKDEINYVYCVDFECSKKIRLPKNNNVSYVDVLKYTFPKVKNCKDRPIIIGLGPAGLFCAYMLVVNGIKPIIYERGKCIEERTKDVEEFWKTGILNTSSNVQFGEGGAGTFSDGKLNTLVKDKSGRNKEVLRILVSFGAPEEIMYDNKPHIGTDILKNVVSNMTRFIKEKGGEIYYNSCVDDFFIDEHNNLTGISVNGNKIEARKVILAIGHSARDTFELLHDSNVLMEPKAFAVGYRVMHPQSMIDNNQYGDYEGYDLPVASYKVTSNFDRGVYSFCMCPGGYVVNASSENGRTAVNGMSYHDRASKVANSAIIVQVTPKDFDSDDVLAGMYWQRKIEEKTFSLADGKIPLQKYADFKAKISPEISNESILDFKPECKGEYKYCDLTDILPRDINASFIQGMEYFGNKIKHFNDGNTILAGIESRTSSPVRINRDEYGLSNIKGLYPCGEGAGYAGGITSAAMDGIYIAECIAKY